VSLAPWKCSLIESFQLHAKGEVRSVMAKTVEKTRKEIAKKKGGTVNALHERSRDSRRLHRAQVRDERLNKILDSRKRREQPMCKRSGVILNEVLRTYR
jgi:hypothetical protein